MPKTKPIYIDATSQKYENLQQEILDIHSKCDDFSTTGIPEAIEAVQAEVDELRTSTSAIDNEILQTLDEAKGVYISIDERFNALSDYDILNELEKISTTREYEYDTKGSIKKEKIRGDLNYDVTYYYNDNDEVFKEIHSDLDGNILGYKEYGYDSNGNIVTNKSYNAENVMTVTTTLVTEELSKRIAKIEAIDFVELGKLLDGKDVVELFDTVQHMLTRIQHLELNLPENIGYLINTSEIYRKLQELENTIHATYVEASFDTIHGQDTYPVPENISKKRAAIYLEGLLLEHGTDYIFTDNNIVFKIELIEGFTVTCRN